MLKNNKSESNGIDLTKELFIESMIAIEDQFNHDQKCCVAFKTILPNDYTSGYDNHWLLDQLLKILKTAMNDNHKDSWIDYYIWDLNFGKNFKIGCITKTDGSTVSLSNNSELYDFLIDYDKLENDSTMDQ